MKKNRYEIVVAIRDTLEPLIMFDDEGKKCWRRAPRFSDVADELGTNYQYVWNVSKKLFGALPVYGRTKRIKPRPRAKGIAPDKQIEALTSRVDGLMATTRSLISRVEALEGGGRQPDQSNGHYPRRVEQ